jgi:hypothetical protein
MIIISKLKLVALMVLVVLLTIPTASIGHALYTINLPSNTIYADDFENYPTLSCSSNARTCLPGWGAYDNATGGIANITRDRSFSPSYAALLVPGPAVNSKIDRHRSIALDPAYNTSTYSASIHFAFTDAIRNDPNAANSASIHFALETIDNSNQHECVLEVFPHGTLTTNFELRLNDGALAFTGNGYALRAVNAGGEAGNPAGIMMNEEWHSVNIIENIGTLQCLQFTIDGLNLLSTPIAMTNHAFTSYQNYQKPLRIEIATIQGNTASLVYNVYFDDLIVSKASGLPVIQFGIVAASGLFQLILITTAMMYVSSGFASVMRVFAKEKTPKFLGPKFIIITGVVGTTGFLFMLIVGANLVAPACPVGFTCTG